MWFRPVSMDFLLEYSNLPIYPFCLFVPKPGKATSRLLQQTNLRQLRNFYYLNVCHKQLLFDALTEGHSALRRLIPDPTLIKFLYSDWAQETQSQTTTSNFIHRFMWISCGQSSLPITDFMRKNFYDHQLLDIKMFDEHGIQQSRASDDGYLPTGQLTSLKPAPMVRRSSESRLLRKKSSLSSLSRNRFQSLERGMIMDTGSAIRLLPTQTDVVIYVLICIHMYIYIYIYVYMCVCEPDYF